MSNIARQCELDLTNTVFMTQILTLCLSGISQDEIISDILWGLSYLTKRDDRMCEAVFNFAYSHGSMAKVLTYMSYLS